MHPVIRISIFLIFTFFIIQAKPGQLLMAGFILLCASILQEQKYRTLMYIMIWRLKWFYLSIVILYSFVSPNFPVLDDSSTQIFTNIIPVLLHSFIKIMVLILIVVSVIVLIVSIPKQELIASLIILSKPFQWLGFPAERFAVRLYLIIDCVEKVPELIKSNTTLVHHKSKVKQIVFSLHLLMSEIYKLAENTECNIIRYDKMPMPRLYQWIYIFISIGLFYIGEFVYAHLLV